MMTLRQFASGIEAIPATTSWYLADLGEARGKQDLFTRQSPQRLKVLRENALIESAVSSNRIEGVEADQARIATIVFGKGQLRDRNEEETRGYGDALELIHERGFSLLFILKTAYAEFEEWAGQLKSPRGAKTALVEAAIEAFPEHLSLNELARACPGVTRDMVRRVLRDLQKARKVACLGRGPGATWQKAGITPK